MYWKVSVFAARATHPDCSTKSSCLATVFFQLRAPKTQIKKLHVLLFSRTSNWTLNFTELVCPRYCSRPVSWVLSKRCVTLSLSRFWPCCSHKWDVSWSRRTSKRCWSRRLPWLLFSVMSSPSLSSETGAGWSCSTAWSTCWLPPRRLKRRDWLRLKRNVWPRSVKKRRGCVRLRRSVLPSWKPKRKDWKKNDRLKRLPERPRRWKRIMSACWRKLRKLSKKRLSWRLLWLLRRKKPRRLLRRQPIWQRRRRNSRMSWMIWEVVVMIWAPSWPRRMLRTKLRKISWKKPRMSAML